METRRRNIGSILLFSIFATPIHAASLCNSSCTLTITFPTGGTIEPIEPLIFTFGSGGLVDTVGSVTAYLDGETLNLGTGDLLSFGNGGSFEIGTTGNIDYIDMVVTTGGTVTLSAGDGA